MNPTIAPYWELTKPRICLMVAITTGVGYILGLTDNGFDLLTFLELLAWSTLSCAGVGTLNQYLESDADLKMERTKNRPLPQNLISRKSALFYGLSLALLGTLLLALRISFQCGLLSFITVFLYLAVYTPLKRKTWWNTFIGAVPGALPPLGGWIAARGGIEMGGVILFLILFLWQHPHFYAIAWMYKDDYARGGFKMLPVIEPDGKKTVQQIYIYLGLLVIVTFAPVFFSQVSVGYYVGAFLLLYMFFNSAIKFSQTLSRKSAVGLLKASIVYLPCVLLLMVLQVQF